METIFQSANIIPEHMTGIAEIVSVTDARSFYMVGACRSGIQTANNFQAVRDVAMQLELTVPGKKEIVIAPIPAIPVFRCLIYLVL